VVHSLFVKKQKKRNTTLWCQLLSPSRCIFKPALSCFLAWENFPINIHTTFYLTIIRLLMPWKYWLTSCILIVCYCSLTLHSLPLHSSLPPHIKIIIKPIQARYFFLSVGLQPTKIGLSSMSLQLKCMLLGKKRSWTCRLYNVFWRFFWIYSSV